MSSDKELIVFKEHYPFGGCVVLSNKVVLGEIFAKEDGFYDFWPDIKGGYWPAWLMRIIADKLDEMNAPWQKQIDEDPTIGG